MKATLVSFLALGLTGVFAAPAPESELAAKPPCSVICKPGYVLSGTKCKCVLNNEQICLRETICIGTHHPVWNAKQKKCTCEPYDFVAEEKCLRETICIATHHPVWNSSTKKCSCEVSVIQDPSQENCLIATTCLEGSHPFWNPNTKKCSCNSNDAEFICKAATTCIPGSTPVWHPETESCICEKVAKRQDVSDPKTCPTIHCAEGYKPKYTPGKAHCICEKLPVDPKTCPTIKCSASFKPLYDPSTKTCSCVPDPSQCTNWMCIAEKRPVYDPISKECGCQWIPGLEPQPIATAAPTSPCATILCITEKTPKVNEKGVCECVWIPGLEPKPTATSKPDGSYERAVEAQIPKPVLPTPIVSKPGPIPFDPLNCRRLKVYCDGGDHYMVYDPKVKRCVCPKVKVVVAG